MQISFDFSWPHVFQFSNTTPDEATLNSEEIKPVAIASIELHLSECISKGVSQWVNQSVENLTKYKILKTFWSGLEMILKTFLSLAMPNLYCLDVTK